MLPSTTSAAQGADVTQAIRSAAHATGVSFDYLLRTAIRESSLDPRLEARTSSATGLFQFIEQTWLAMVKEEGAKFGYGDLAAGITRSASGRYEVADPALKRAILALRKDPQASALMAGAFSARNARALSRALGRAPSEGELYLAHFFGPAGAARFLQLAARDPSARADAAFPQAARANRSIFYDRTGAARSLREVQAVLTKRHTATAVAAAPATPVAPAATAPAAPAPAILAYAPEPAAAEPLAFHGLFRTGRDQPIDGGLAALWAPASAPARAGAIGSPLELATFLRAPTRAAGR